MPQVWLGLWMGGCSFLLGFFHLAGLKLPGIGKLDSILAKLLLPLGAVIIYMALFC